uniref:Uncharacterized protein n=1 Tax=Podarcis muralis TaxID=64176 RepID=A0A670KFM9_PODMU
MPWDRFGAATSPWKGAAGMADNIYFAALTMGDAWLGNLALWCCWLCRCTPQHPCTECLSASEKIPAHGCAPQCAHPGSGRKRKEEFRRYGRYEQMTVHSESRECLEIRLGFAGHHLPYVHRSDMDWGEQWPSKS